jgi:hypothetical protein
MSTSNQHKWSFSTVGGVKRVNLESGKDLMHLSQLDQKLWTALSCPVVGLEIDEKTLQLIDSDNDGQIRVPEIITSVEWILSLLKNPDDVLKSEQNLPLSAINTETEEGNRLYKSAKIILKNLGKEDQASLTVEETSDIHKIFAGSAFNGDGIVTHLSTYNNELKELIDHISNCYEPSQDRSGLMGVSKEAVDLFFEHCQLYSKWHIDGQQNIKAVLALDNDSDKAYELFETIVNKIDDYFLRLKLAHFDTNTIESLNTITNKIQSITDLDLSTRLEDIANMPIAKIGEHNSLNLIKGINPAWEKELETLKELVINKVFSNITELTQSQWNEIKAIFQPYKSWKQTEVNYSVAKLGFEKIKHYSESTLHQQLLDLIAKDLELSDEANGIILVDQLTRYYRDIYVLLKNFVTFYDFYSPNSKAIFLAGTLYIDQRSCDLCIKVADIAKHSALVNTSGMFLLYCECSSKKNGKKMNIVAALTNGDIDNLAVGRNALFYDRQGNDWDATVIKIVENPISIRQAFFTPYRKVSNLIENQINKIASAEDNKVSATATSQIEEAPTKVETAKAPAQPFDVGKFVGIFAAIGLALGAIGTAITSIVSGFLGLVWWKMPLALMGLMLIISGPSMVIAYLKLRKRNVAPLLDANGWAINARAIVNIQFGNTLTQLAELPKGAYVNYNDPFTKKKKPMLGIVFLLSMLVGSLLFLAWYLNWIHLPF